MQEKECSHDKKGCVGSIQRLAKATWTPMHTALAIIRTVGTSPEHPGMHPSSNLHTCPTPNTPIVLGKAVSVLSARSSSLRDAMPLNSPASTSTSRLPVALSRTKPLHGPSAAGRRVRALRSSASRVRPCSRTSASQGTPWSGSWLSARRRADRDASWLMDDGTAVRRFWAGKGKTARGWVSGR